MAREFPVSCSFHERPNGHPQEMALEVAGVGMRLIPRPDDDFCKSYPNFSPLRGPCL